MHPDERAARVQFRDALADRVAAWRAQRDGVDLCEEPGCRGVRDGCRLVHPAPVRRAKDGRAAGEVRPPLEPTGLPTVHDDRMDRMDRMDREAQLRAAGWKPVSLVRVVAERMGASPTGVLNGARTHAECGARAAVIHVACDGAAVPVNELARVLGVSAAAVSAARPRGRRVLADLGWSVDLVVAWSLRLGESQSP